MVVMDIVSHQHALAPAVRNFAVFTEANSAHRQTMEDTHRTEPHLMPGVAFFAVFDGHGGAEAADCASENMHKHLAARLGTSSPDSVQKRICDCYLDTDKTIKDAGIQVAGCTVATALVLTEDGQRMLYAANAGDSRVVLMRGGQAIRLTVDHNPALRSEYERITGAGGCVAFNRVNGILAVSRSLGDHMMKELVVANPEISRAALCPLDHFLIIACDGLWDVVEDQEACDFVSQMATHVPTASISDICTALGRLALTKGSRDNITIVLVWL